MEVLKANIIDNQPFCPKCNKSNLQQTGDYKLVSIKGTKYTEFTCRCMNCKNTNVYYQVKITMQSNERFSYDRSEEIEIKEEKTNN